MTQRSHKPKAKTRSSRQIAAPKSLTSPTPVDRNQSIPDHAQYVHPLDPSPTSTSQDAPAFLAGPGASSFQPPLPLSQLLAQALAHPAPALPISGLLPAGLTLLSAKPHAGSRTLALHLALAIARGTSALAHFPTPPADVLYLNFHEAQATLLTRAQHLLAGASLPSNFTCTNTWDTWEHDGLASLEHWLTSHPHTRLLVIDSLTRLLPPGTSTRHAYALLTHLNHLAHTHHLCVLLLHSQPRHAAQDPFDALACSHLLLDACETLAVLEHERGAELATLHLTGHTLKTQHLSLLLDPDADRWSLDTTSLHPQLSPERLAILRALEQSPPGLKPTEIASALHKESGTIRRLLFSMVRAGLVIAQPDGRYLSLHPAQTIISLVETDILPTSQSFPGEDDHNSLTNPAPYTHAISVTPTPSSASPGDSTPVTVSQTTIRNTSTQQHSFSILHVDTLQEPGGDERSEMSPPLPTTKEISPV